MPKKKKSAKCKSRKVHSRELVVDDQQASSFAGLSLVEKFASHFGIWIYAAKKLSVRRGIERLPGEKVFCEDLKRFGSEGVLRAMHRICLQGFETCRAGGYTD